MIQRVLLVSRDCQRIDGSAPPGRALRVEVRLGAGRRESILDTGRPVLKLSRLDGDGVLLGR